MINLDVYVANRSLFINTRSYVLNQALSRLKKSGISFRILEQVEPSLKSGNNAFIHVDLTVLPKHYRQVSKVYARSINGNAISIAKNIFSQAILTRGSEYSGPVIVKTNLNHRGLPELCHAIKKGSFGPPHTVNKQKLIQIYSPEYTLLDSIKNVPTNVWANPGLIVEKFIPGNLNLPVIKYRHDFFLDVELNTKSTFDSLLCDPDKLIKTEFYDEVPDAVKHLRSKLNLDFGSIDFFIADKKVFIIDANKTTALTMDWIERFPQVKHYMDSMSERLVAFARI